MSAHGVDREARLYALLARLDSLRARGEELSLSQLCGADPDLAEELRRRLQAVAGASPLPERLTPNWWRELEVDATVTWPPVCNDVSRDSAENFRGTERFEVRRRIGCGGMGVVYAAHDRLWNEDVALKTLQCTNAVGISYLKREFRALTRIHHPNLIQLYELLSVGDTWFFTMELLHGSDFLSHVRPGSRLDEQRLRQALRQLVHGLTTLHDAGIIHRDIKPSNVLVTTQGRLVLLDFGLAQEIQPVRKHEALPPYLAGTPHYLAPEVIRCEPATPASDWYAVGTMLFEALSGQPLFSGTGAEVLQRKLLQPPPDPQLLASSLPEEWRQVLLRLLSREPDLRRHSRKIFASFPGLAGSLPTPELSTPPFVGRAEALDALNEALVQVQLGRTLVRIVEGNSGIGKTTLLHHFVRSINDPAVLVLAGRCHEREAVPFNAFDEIADSLARWLESVPDELKVRLVPAHTDALRQAFPTLGQAVSTARDAGDDVRGPRRAEDGASGNSPRLSPDQRLRLFKEFRELLTRIGEYQVVILCIDDLQWGDGDSAAMLTELICVTNPPRLLFIGCCRRELLAASVLLQQIKKVRLPTSRQVDLRDISLEPLREDEARTLAGAILGQRAAATLLKRLVEQSAGHPYLLCEYLRRGNRHDKDGIVSADELDDLLWADIEELDTPHRHVMELVAVAGQPLQLSILHEACGWKETSWQMAITRLFANRLVQLAGTTANPTVAAFHDRIRELVLKRLSPERLRELHLQLAGTHEAHSPQECEALARHYEGAGVAEKAHMYALRAADQAFHAFAFDRAAQFYETALRLKETAPREEQNLRLRLADALAGTGKGALAAEQFLRVAASAEPDIAVELRMRAVLHLSANGRFDQGWHEFVKVCESAELSLSPCESPEPVAARNGLLSLERRAYICWLAAQVAMTYDMSIGSALYRQFFALSEASGDRNLRALALGIRAVYASLELSTRTAYPLLITAAFESAETDASPFILGYLNQHLGWLQNWEANWDDAAESFQRAYDFWSQCPDGGHGRSWSWGYLAIAFYYRGRLAEINRRIWPMLKVARERDDAFVLTTTAMHYGVLGWLMDDDVPGAREVLQAGVRNWTWRRHWLVEWQILIAQIHTDLYRETGPAAWQAVEQHREVFATLSADSEPLRVISLNHEGQALLAAVISAGTRSPQLEQRLQDIIQQLRSSHLAFAAPLGGLLDAGYESSRSNKEAALQQYDDAACTFATLKMDSYFAAARRAQGSLRGGPEGAALVAAADDWLRGEGVRRPDRFAAMIAPGSSSVS